MNAKINLYNGCGRRDKPNRREVLEDEKKTYKYFNSVVVYVFGVNDVE